MEDNFRRRPNELSLSRVKTIMKSSPDVENVSQESVYLVTKSTELFIKYMVEEAYSASNNAKTLEYKHVSDLVQTSELLGFLREIVPRKCTLRDIEENLRQKGKPLRLPGMASSSSDISLCSDEESTSPSVVESGPEYESVAVGNSSPSSSRSGQEFSKPGPACSKQGCGYSKPGPASSKPGAAHSRPGPASTKSGATHVKPGPACSKPGGTSTKPGPACSKPGNTYSKPGPACSKPGGRYSKPGPACSKAGLAYSKPGPACSKPGSTASSSKSGQSSSSLVTEDMLMDVDTPSTSPLQSGQTSRTMLTSPPSTPSTITLSSSSREMNFDDNSSPTSSFIDMGHTSGTPPASPKDVISISSDSNPPSPSPSYSSLSPDIQVPDEDDVSQDSSADDMVQD